MIDSFWLSRLTGRLFIFHVDICLSLRCAMASILDLPEDTVRDIFTRLDPRDLIQCESTCAAWRRLLDGDEDTWRVVCENPVEPPNKLNYAPNPEAVQDRYRALQADDDYGEEYTWRDYAEERGKCEITTLEKLQNISYDWLNDNISFHSEFRDGCAVHAARVTRLGCEELVSTSTSHAVHFVEPSMNDLNGDARLRRRLRRDRFKCIASYAAIYARHHIRRQCVEPPGFADFRTPEYTCTQVERAVAHVATLLWDGYVERDFRNDGVRYEDACDARSALNVDPRAVHAAFDKLGAEFARRLVSEKCNPNINPHRATEILKEYFSGEVAQTVNKETLFLLDPRVPAPTEGGLGFKGVEAQELFTPLTGNTYYEPRNSSLSCVLNTQRGIPITLTIVLCAIARRGGLTPVYMNTSGHFLCGFVTHQDAGGRTLDMVDPYNGCAAVGSPVHVEANSTLQVEVRNPQDVVARVLRNLLMIYQKKLCPRPGMELIAGSNGGTNAREPTIEKTHQALTTYHVLIQAMWGVHDSFLDGDSEPRSGLPLQQVRQEIGAHLSMLAEYKDVLETGTYRGECCVYETE